MYSEYTCLFINFKGEICEKSCMYEEEYSIYWKYVIRLANKPLISCTENGCKKYTKSKSG